MSPGVLGKCGGRSNDLDVGEKIAFHDELADLGMPPFDLERLTQGIKNNIEATSGAGRFVSSRPGG